MNYFDERSDVKIPDAKLAIKLNHSQITEV